MFKIIKLMTRDQLLIKNNKKLAKWSWWILRKIKQEIEKLSETYLT